jgi:hypothetical protein
MLTQIEVDKRMTAYLGCPEGGAKRPAIIHLHERYGIVKHTLDLAFTLLSIARCSAAVLEASCTRNSLWSTSGWRICFVFGYSQVRCLHVSSKDRQKKPCPVSDLLIKRSGHRCFFSVK